MRRPEFHAPASLIVVLITATLFAGASLATDQVIEDVRMSKSGDTATAEVALGCPMRYLDHSPRQGGGVLTVRLSLSPECRRVLGGVRSEMRHPRAGHLGHLKELELELLGLDEATLTVRFDKPVGFTVRQGGIGNLLWIDVHTGAQVGLEPPSIAAGPPVAPKPREVPDRSPMRLRRVTPATDNAYFVLSLASLPPEAAVDLTPLAGVESITPYIRRLTVGARRWQELRVGFFATESDARTALAALPGDWPQAWVAIATVDERADARSARQLIPAGANQDAVAAPEAVRSDGAGGAQGLSEEQIVALMAEARTALINQQYDRSVRIYTEVLEENDYGQRPAAREYLGLAREKKGQFAHAKAEYDAYLAEFPDRPEATRVQQRLAGLVGMAAASREPLRPSRQPESAQWEIYGGFSQFYRRDVNQFHEEDEEMVNQSAFISRADLVVQRRGQRFDFIGRMNGAYYYDMLDDDEHGPGDQGLASYAYLDVIDNESGVAARVGRQTRYSGGVLGRFDGAHVSYAWKPDLTINITTGFPVDSPRYEPETDHVFYGASVDLTNVADVWDFSVFTNLARVDGISDREAVGAEARFVTEQWNLISLVDVDLSYNVLNSAMFIGNWRTNDRLTINGRIDIGARPFLTTRNALIGQPVASIDELLDIYTESEVRRLARNRTAEAHSGSLGFSASIGERFYWNTDVTYSHIDDTVESAGVAALPDTGAQYFITSNLVGSSLLRPGDTGIFGLRHYVTRTSDTSTVIADFRYPVTDGLRINPRIALSYRQREIDGTDEWIASPGLRLIYRWRRRYRLEFEAGGHWSTQDVALPTNPGLSIDDTEETSAYFLNLGYMVDF